MIAKRVARTARGSSYRELAEYILDRKGGAGKVRQAWATNCCIPDDLNLCIKEVVATQELNTRSRNDKTYHLVISLRADEDLTNDQFRDVEERFCRAIGFGDHQRISAIHTDTGNVHMHVALSKVHPTTLNCVEPFYDKLRLQEVCRELEQTYGLKKDIGVGPKVGITAFEQQRGIESFVGYITRNLAPELRKLLNGVDPTWDQLQALAGKFGLEIRERGRGLVFSHTDERLFVKASSVDSTFSRAGLEAILGAFEPRRGSPAVSQRYEQQPIGQSPDGNALFAEYQAESRKTRELRQERLSQIYKSRADRTADIRQRYALRRSEIRSDVVLAGAAKRRVRQKLAMEMKKEIEACLYNARSDLDKVRKSHLSRSWRDWLLQKANEGNETALEALRVGSTALHEEGAGQISGTEAKTILFRGERKVLKNGTVEYHTGRGKIVDTRASIIIKDLNEQNLEIAIRMAQVRFGECRQHTGSDQFMGMMSKLMSQNDLAKIDKKKNPTGPAIQL